MYQVKEQVDMLCELLLPAVGREFVDELRALLDNEFRAPGTRTSFSISGSGTARTLRNCGRTAGTV